MLKKILLAVMLGLGLNGALFAAEDVPVETRMIGGAFKTMAKAYVATADIEKLKSQRVQWIESMKEEWFRAKYAEVYPDIRRMPPAIPKKYGITEKMTRAQAIRIVRTMDKKKLYEIIDSVPDAVIARRFNEQFQADEPGKKVSLQEKIAKAWDRFLIKVNQGTPAGKAQKSKP